MLRTVYYKLKAMTSGPIVFTAMLLVSFICFLTVYGILSDTTAKAIRICVIDNDGSDRSAQYCEELMNTPGIEVSVLKAADAEALMRRGNTEALLYIEEGFGNAMESQGKLPLVFVCEGLGVSGEAAREILGGKALSMQSALDALKRLKEEYNLQGESVTDSFYRYLELSEQETVPVLEYIRHESAETADRPVFGRSYARFSGFAALVIFLFVMSLSVMFSTEASVSVNRGCRIVKGGAFTALFTDFLALFTAAALLCAAALAAKLSRSPLEWISYLSYAVLISGICMLLSFTRAAGGIDMAAPLFALVTGVIGGCFFDISALGRGFETLSYFTPQGLLIGAVGGKSFCILIMFIAGVLCFTASFIISAARD